MNQKQRAHLKKQLTARFEVRMIPSIFYADEKWGVWDKERNGWAIGYNHPRQRTGEFEYKGYIREFFAVSAMQRVIESELALQA